MTYVFSEFWRILMQGPPDTPYKRGVFELYSQFGPDYPAKPPVVRFVTRVSCRVQMTELVTAVGSVGHACLLNTMTGVPLQRQQRGTHLPQHL